MTARRARVRTLTAAAAVLALVLSGATAGAHAAPSKPGYQLALDGPTAASLLAMTGTTPLDLDLALITGDRIRVGLRGDGKPVVRDIVAAPRPGGAEVAFHTIKRYDRSYVVPADALSLVADGVLDLELFNIAKLAALAVRGRAADVPVIVEHQGRELPRAASTAPGATVRRKLPRVHATSLAIRGDGTWWGRVVGRTGRTGRTSSARSSTGPLSGVDKIWLNELATIQLAESVPMTKAPAAWAAGYDGTGVTVAVLDTGVDPDHPDLAGRIASQADFTGDAAGARDGNGHGTHVAATIAGSGAASDGRRRGVAPGAALAIGKVCNNHGSCTFDSIIAGMEWAAGTGARVVNMSLGAGPTDGTDLLSTVVNELSRATGVLFVIAAGNSGPAPETVATPGAADEALTVAAIDKSGNMARFSGRGPRRGDGAAKPDIAAPGVSIVAARAAGTALGKVVDARYTSANGTSMATPHVAGAAAILAQRHPDLAGRGLKALLMDSAADRGHDVYAQGAGLVDVSAAVNRTVASSGTVAFGRHAYPHQPVARTVTYTNLSDQAVTLSLATTMVSGKGGAAPAGLLTATPRQLTIPAAGTGEATLTLDGRALGGDGVYGRYLGTLTATDDAGTVRASGRVTAMLEARRFETTVRVIPPAGVTDVTYGSILVAPMDDQVYLHDDPVALNGGPSASTNLYAGGYAVGTSVGWRDARGERHTALVSRPEVTVTGPTSVTFDLRKARPVAARTPQRTETNGATLQLRRISATGDWELEGTLRAGYGSTEPHWWTLPTKPVRRGTFRYINAQVLVPPLVTMRTTGGPGRELHPRYVSADRAVDAHSQVWTGDDEGRWIVPLVPHLPDKGRVPVVHAGTGTAQELAAAKVRGALVLVTPTDICDAACPYQALRERIDLAAERGAVGVIVGGRPGGADLGRPSTDQVTCPQGRQSCPAPAPYSAVPVVSLPAAEAAALAHRLTRGGPVSVRLGGEPDVPEAYALSFVDDHVPSTLPHRVDRRDLDPVVHRIHGTRPGMLNPEGFSWARALPALSRDTEPGLNLPRVATGQTLTVRVGPRRKEALDRFRLGTVYFDEPYVVTRPDHLRTLPLWFWPTEIQEVVVRHPTTLTWNSGPVLPGTHTGDHTASGFGTDWGSCAGCREGDRFWPVMSLTGSSGAVKDRMVGMVNDTGAGYLLYFGAGCEPPRCTSTLYDAAGHKIPQQLVPVGFTIGTAGRSHEDLVHQLVNGSPADSGRAGGAK